jgi:Rps23 Pro-64 3,4-dihydroxylase Tpa1-like proline 4-hydroxylase
LTASLAIPIQESSAEKEKKGKDYDGEKEKKGKDYDGEKEKNYDSIKQMNECSDSVIACINIICQAAEVCIIPQDSFTRIALPI